MNTCNRIILGNSVSWGGCEITTGKLDANAMVQDGQFDFYTSGIDVYKIDKAAFEGPVITIAGNGTSV